MAYSSDVVEFPTKSLEILSNLEYWIVDALRLTPHPTHAHLDLTLKWIDEYKCKKGETLEKCWKKASVKGEWRHPDRGGPYHTDRYGLRH